MTKHQWPTTSAEGCQKAYKTKTKKREERDSPNVPLDQ